MAYAIIRSGGKQYRVSEGQTLRLEKLNADEGAEIELGDVIALGEGSSLNLDASTLSGKAVVGQVVRHGRGRKLHLWKFKRRQGYQTKQGHRQDFTEVRITSIPS